MFWNKLGIGNRSFEISNFKPDFVFFGKEDKVVVDAESYDLTSKLMGSESFFSYSGEGF